MCVSIWCLSLRLFVCLYLSQSVYLLFVCLSVSISVCLSICLPFCLALPPLLYVNYPPLPPPPPCRSPQPSKRRPSGRGRAYDLRGETTPPLPLSKQSPVISIAPIATEATRALPAQSSSPNSRFFRRAVELYFCLLAC